MAERELQWSEKVLKMAEEHAKYQAIIVKLRRFLDFEVRSWLPYEHTECGSGCRHRAEENERWERLELMLEDTQIDPPKARPIEEVPL